MNASIRAIFVIVFNVSQSYAVIEGEPITRLWNEGASLIAKEQTTKARQVFMHLLERAPDFYPRQDTSPKILAFFTEVREEYKQTLNKQQAFTITHRSMWAHDTFTFSMTMGHSIDQITRQVRIYFRMPDQVCYQSVTIDQNHAVPIPLKSEQNSVFYYVELIGRWGAPFFTIGTALNPLYAQRIMPMIESPKYVEPDSHLVTNWPIFVGIIATILGVATYSIMKMYYF